MLGQWWTLAPMIVEMMVAATLPAVFWVRARVRSSVLSLAVAPAITFALITALSILFDKAGISWQREHVLPVLGVLTVLGALVLLFTKVREASGGRLPRGGIVAALGPRKPLGAAQSRVRASTWAMILLGSLLAALPMLLRANPGLPPQQWDSTFHLNGVWSILRSGSASPFGGLSELYGGREVFYPTTWHAFTALFATPPTVIRAANTSSIVLMIIWVIGATALTSVITRRRGAILAAPVLAGLLLDMPADNLTMYNQWPNAMGLAAVPGVAALAVILGRRIGADSPRGVRALLPHLHLGLLLLLGAAGASAAHPSSAFVLAALLIPAFLAGALDLARRAAAARAWGAVIGLGLLAALVTVMPFLVLTTDKIRAMGDYPRAGYTWAYAFSHMFTPAPPFTQTTALSVMTVLQAGLTILGIAVITGLVTPLLGAVPGEPATPAAAPGAGTRIPGGPADAPAAEPPALEAHPAPAPRSHARPRADEPLWPIASYLVFCLLTMLAYAPLGEVRTFLLAPWYLDARRIMGAHGLTMVPLMAIGFDLLASRAHRLLTRAGDRADAGAEGPGRALPGSAGPRTRPRIARWRVDALIGVLLLLLSGLGALDSRLAATDYVYDPERLGKPGMADTAELAMIRRMRLLIPGDSLVLGDPIAGAAYTEVIGQHEAVFPQLTMTNGQERWQQVLSHRFRDIHSDPEVCEVVKELGITHFYEDEDGWYYDFKRSSRSPGLYGVDTSTGFELVDQGGSAKLYRITACGEIRGGGSTGAR